MGGGGDGVCHQSLGAWKSSQAQTRGGAVRMPNRPHVTQTLKVGPAVGCVGLTRKPGGPARGQDSDVARSSARSFRSKRQMQEEFGNILLCWVALWLHVQTAHPPKLGTTTLLKKERLASLSSPISGCEGPIGLRVGDSGGGRISERRNLESVCPACESCSESKAKRVPVRGFEKC